jgi:hypothetical protein
MADYADILNKSWDEIPEVVPVPKGSYLLKGQNATFQPAKGEDGSPSVLFVYRVKEPMDDVDTGELAALGDNYDLEANRIFTRFWINDGSDWDKVRKHLTKHGVPLKGNIADSLKEFKGAEVVAFVDQRNFTDNAGQSQTENTAANFTPVA